MQHSDYNVIQSYILVVIVWMFFVHLVLNVILEFWMWKGGNNEKKTRIPLIILSSFYLFPFICATGYLKTDVVKAFSGPSARALDGNG